MVSSVLDCCCGHVPGGSFWDFGRGKLAERWEARRELSVVGRTFAELQSR
jgi:hypothetical protein